MNITSSNGIYTNNALFQNTNSIYNILSGNYNMNRISSKAASNEKKLSSSAMNFVTNVKTQSENLKLAMLSLTGNSKTNSVFDQKTAVSSDTGALSIKNFNTTKNNFNDMYVNIKQTAAAQKNTGNAMKAENKNFTAGLNTIEIESGGKKTLVSFTVSLKDNNQTAQQKMADAINSKNAGVTASVTYDPNKKTSILKIESLTTGKNEDESDKFTIRDKQGDSVAVSGTGDVTEEARNALYSVNGGEIKESKTNAVDLGNGVTAQLIKASEDDIKISIGTDKKASLNKTREMVNAYNGLLAAAEDNESDKRTKNLINELRQTVTTYMPQLKRAGISINENGYMKIDEKKMDEASDNGVLKKLFKGEGNGANYGLSYRMSKTAEKVNGNPFAYVSKTAESDAGKLNNVKEDNWLNINYSQLNKLNQLSGISSLFEITV